MHKRESKTAKDDKQEASVGQPRTKMCLFRPAAGFIRLTWRLSPFHSTELAVLFLQVNHAATV
jgi:hypothetical protein